MKEDKRLYLADLKANLQMQMHYDNPNYAWDVLLYGWAKKYHHTTEWLSMIKRRGWISLRSAKELEEYCGYNLR